MMGWVTTLHRHAAIRIILLASLFLAGCNPSVLPSGESAGTGGEQGATGVDMVSTGLSMDVAGQVTGNGAASVDGTGGEHPVADEPAASSGKDAPDVATEAGVPRDQQGEAVQQTESDERAQSRQRAEPAHQAEWEQQGEQAQPAQQDQPVTEQAPQTSVEQTTVEQAIVAWDGDNTLTFGEMYASVGVRGVQLSDKLIALTGKEVEMSGFMAPPLTAGVRFFVLTKVLMAVCPFCSTDEDWPADIVVVYLPDGEELNPTEHPVKVTGTLETGSFTDEETGFVSLVRIYADKVEVLD